MSVRRVFAMLLSVFVATHSVAADDKGLAGKSPAKKESAKKEAVRKSPARSEVDERRVAARDRGLAWLREHQAANGSWGRQYTLAVTGFAVLAQLAAADEPFEGPRGSALIKGLRYLMSQQKEGMFQHKGRTWIHEQGFAALALSEAYGRSLTCKNKPEYDMKAVRGVVEKAVQAIARHQSTSGGWWYQPGVKSRHEGSTTVCAVQALVSADNFGIEIDKKVLERGFEYLKKCQNKDGGFDYMMGPGERSMKEGTAGGVSTLGLMRKFDYKVMMDGYKFLLKINPQAIGRGSFPYYGSFYGIMGMRLLRQEMPGFAKDIDAYSDGAVKALLSRQQKDGRWPAGFGQARYSTAFATLALSIPDGRLSIFNRQRPNLKKKAGK